jgi:bacillithiol biosynthesis cysteine-adding enzyme BshC
MDALDYRSLPASAGGYSDLFFDYLSSAPAVEPFFRRSFRSPDAYGAVIEEITRRSPDRKTLVAVLRDQNIAFGAGPATLAAAGLLAHPTTFAVVTGQQVSLFGGPLYTLYKTITTIKLARSLKGRYPAYDFVPVFWLEGEDHDFEEMHHTNVLNAENTVVPLAYLPGGVMPERNVGAVGEMVFDETLTQTMAALTAALPPTEFTAPLLQRLQAAYRPGTTFTHAFAAWMLELFGSDGLVFISPQDVRLKRILSPLFQQEVRTFPRSSQLVIERSAQLEERYHAQIKAKSLNLFLFHKGGRYLIEPRENDFSLKGTRHFFPPEELARIAAEQPELLSANVILRPLAQDTLLPTVAYVAGPSEVAYHAQLGPVYDDFGVPQPIVFPRASATFVEGRTQRAMEKYDIQLIEFFGDLQRVSNRVLESIAEIKLDALFERAGGQFHAAFNELRFALKEVDPTLVGAIETVTGKFEGTLATLKEKALVAQKRRNETAMRQIEKTANGLLPSGGLQEREINLLTYLDKYGPDLVGRLLTELDIELFKHQILTL